MYVVQDCFNWIGFHITEKLLNKGNEVAGIGKVHTEKEEHLALSIGRNSLFYHLDFLEARTFKDKKVNSLFTINHDEQIKEFRRLNWSKWFHFTSQLVQNCEKQIQIQLPLLFGEWMPRDSNGLYDGNNYIRFDSQQFKQSAIYIDDFVDAILQMEASSSNPERVEYMPLREIGASLQKTAESLYIRDSASIEKRVTQLNNHYQQFKDLY